MCPAAPLPGLPGAAQPKGPAPVKTTIYNTFGYAVGVNEDGNQALILTDMAGHQMVFEFNPEDAKKVGRQLAAPHVQVPV
jgi:hypothetical protein